MHATQLSDAIWNAIADLVRRSTSQREIYHVEVTKVDKARHVLWADEFGDIGIPVVVHSLGHSFYDTQPDGTVVKKGEDYETNDAYQAKIIMPKVGDSVVVLDPGGAKLVPICIGVIQSPNGYWEGG